MDDCYFGAPYLLYLKSVFDKNCWDSNSNLVFMVKFLLNPRCYEDLACILVQGGLVLDSICSVKYGAFFSVARAFLDSKIFFHDFLVKVCF